jgi:hypothetical protein
VCLSSDLTPISEWIAHQTYFELRLVLIISSLGQSDGGGDARNAAAAAAAAVCHIAVTR